MSVYRLSREVRRVTCVHEAGHAVLHALSGAFIYRMAVAPEGASDWTTTGRKGDAMADLWGVCEPSGSPGLGFVHCDAEDLRLVADRTAFAAMLQLMEANAKGAMREGYRQIRAHVCGAMAGPVAEQIFKGEEPDHAEVEWVQFDDRMRAEALCLLLPWRTRA